MRMFCFALARELGMTVRQLLRSMDAHELVEWMSYFEIEREQMEVKTGKKPRKTDPKNLSERLKAAFKLMKGK